MEMPSRIEGWLRSAQQKLDHTVLIYCLSSIGWVFRYADSDGRGRARGFLIINSAGARY